MWWTSIDKVLWRTCSESHLSTLAKRVVGVSIPAKRGAIFLCSPNIDLGVSTEKSALVISEVSVVSI